MKTPYEIKWIIDKKKISKTDIEYIEKSVLRSSIDNKEISSHAWSGELTYGFRVLPKSKIIEIFKFAKFRFFNWDKDYRQDENIIFINAKEDFVNYLILIHIKQTIPMGTALWLVHQSIEKHLKGLLLKRGDFEIEELRRKPYGHDLIKLLEEYKKINSESILFKNDGYKTLINELNSDGQNTGIRYSAGFHMDGAFTKVFIEICTILRLDFLDPKEYEKNDVLQLGKQSDHIVKILTSIHKKYHILPSFINEIYNSQHESKD